MHDPLISGLASEGESQKRSDEGPGVSWLGSAPQARVFSGFQYLTPPEHADMQQKQEAIEKTAPPGSKQKRYRPPDQLLEFLENL
jgi:hypothetical protein